MKLRPRRLTPVLSVFALLALGASSASAATESVSASKLSRTACFKSLRSASAATEVQRVTATQSGLVRARLRGSGDWDLGVFDAKSGRSVAGAAGFHSSELAEGFVTKGQKLVVQACRFGGKARSARMSVGFVKLARARGGSGRTQLVDVQTPTRARKEKLQSLGLDLAEKGDGNSITAVLHGAGDARKLRANKFGYTVKVADLQKRSAANLRSDRRYAAKAGGSDLPSGRDTYRRLPDYDFELKLLARRYPKLVKPVTLNHTTHLGRSINGIEITRNPRNIEDGKPVFLNMGTHHAREWPTAEHSLEFAYDLLTNYSKSARTKRLVNSTRVVIIPVINQDGFNISREGTRPPGSEPFGKFDYEMKRKNCWPDPQNPGPCENNPTAGRLQGVDLNRNYGGFWGGGGASVDRLDDTFRGVGPFSEPETQAVREFIGSRQVTNLITLHTFGNLLLRPPGIADVGFPLDEPVLKKLGARMASRNGYSNIPSFGLYDTSGATEDWSFWSTGGLGYTFEIGDEDFHPAYANAVVGEYLGRAPAAGAGKGGNQAAFYDMLQATANKRLHSTITGKAPKGYKLKLRKSFITSTSPVWQDDFGNVIGDPQTFPDTLTSAYRSKGGKFRWAVNPSTRPVVAGRFGRDAQGPPQQGVSLANPAGVPAENTSWPDDATAEELPFTVGGLPDVDNGKMTVHIEWGNPETDWDLFIVDSNGEVVTQSASFGDTDEDAVLFDPPPGQYKAVVVNYDQVADPPDDWSNGSVSFESPKPTTYGEKESWTLSCEDKRGDVKATRSVTVDRGDSLNVRNVCSPAVAARAGKAGR